MGARPAFRCRQVAVLVASICAPLAGAECFYSVSVIQGPSGPFGAPEMVPLGLNSAGHVVGYWAPIASDEMRAFLWTPEEGFVSLPMPPGTRRSQASDISDAGHICG